MSPIGRRGFLTGAAAAATTVAAAGSARAASAPATATQSAATAVPATATATAGGTAVTPFTVHVPDADLTDLRQRIAAARFPAAETVTDWSQGAPLAKVRALTQYWAGTYDWRRAEATLNGLGSFRTVVDGLGIHFLHIRSPHADALPLIITHGWPGSVFEFVKAAAALTDPTNHGGAASDAFHLVIPSLPGFGFSDKPTTTGWDAKKTAGAWIEIMSRLGYTRYIAQGGDWGAFVTTAMAQQKPAELLGMHTNFPTLLFNPPLTGCTPTPEEQQALDLIAAFQATGSGYFLEQQTEPQTVGYGLTDSAVGQAAWIYEKFGDWMMPQFDPESVVTRDEMLDDISLYWLTASAASSARFYWENTPDLSGPVEVDIPVGVSVFPGEGLRPAKVWAERAYPELVYYNDQITNGGHFAAWEQPTLFTEEMRKFARLLR